MVSSLWSYPTTGDDVVNGQRCEKWQKVEEVGHKINKYTMWLRWQQSGLDPKVKSPVPVHYEMKGFNSLLGSHFDHYYLTYTVSVKETILHW